MRTIMHYLLIVLLLLFYRVHGEERGEEGVDFTGDEYGETDVIPWYGFSPEYVDNKHPATVRDGNRSADKRRAAAVHLSFYQDELTKSDFDRIKKDGWEIKNTIRVTKSAQTTYFAVVTAPWGYAGIQQHEPKHCGKTEGIAKF